MSSMDNSARSIATYYHPGAQEGLQTLYLMNQGFPLYADEPTTAEVHMLNSPVVGTPLNPRVPLHPRTPIHEISNTLQDFPTSSHHPLWGSAVAPQLGLRQPQGLSLTLSPQRTAYAPASSGEVMVTIAASASAGLSNAVSCLQSLWVGSKYLKAAQQLLEEVVSVGGQNWSESLRESGKKNREERRGLKQAAELTPSERQELQMKKAKLLHMFEDLEKRYKLYHNQMQTVANSFEAVAGIGAARTYTALALQTISKQFRCLRDAISGQIREASKRLGEEDGLGGDKFSSSRLSLIGHQIRQQRALQQIAIMQQSAWRPQRGLPERSVSILRAWLFEHFLHPYPKDSDKQMLAKQTGLTRSQVSNWFINARVRLWKPMVEEMYLEEAKEGPEQSSGEEKSSNAGRSPSETEQTTLQLPPIGSPRQATILNGTQALDQSNSMEIANGDGGFGAYAGAEQFGARGLGNGVSLTLGLPHSENLSLSRGHPTFRSRDGVSLGRRVDIGNGNNEPSVALNPITFQGVDVQSSKRLAAQLLRDFVA